LKFLIAAQLSYIKESEEIRLAMLPVELIKRVSVELVLFTIFYYYGCCTLMMLNMPIV